MVSKGMSTILPDDLYHVVAFSVSPRIRASQRTPSLLAGGRIQFPLISLGLLRNLPVGKAFKGE